MTEPGFHSYKRAPKASRPTITVQCAETELKSLLRSFGLLAIDFGIGEPDHERVVLQVSKPGSFSFPVNVKAGELISVRPRELAGTEVTITISWDDPK